MITAVVEFDFFIIGNILLFIFLFARALGLDSVPFLVIVIRGNTSRLSIISRIVYYKSNSSSV